MFWSDFLGCDIEQLAQMRDIFGTKLLRRSLTHATFSPVDMIPKQGKANFLTRSCKTLGREDGGAMGRS